jgi:hypothetical protein
MSVEAVMQEASPTRVQHRHTGAWGTAIFSDDTALDVRDEWRDGAPRKRRRVY